MSNIPVLIAGGGPAGLSLACDLSWRGVEAILVEQSAATTTYPKMDVTNSRTMEHFHRMGIAEEVRAAAVPENHAMYCRWVTDLAGWELAVKANESAADQREMMRLANDGTQPAQPHLRMPQYDLEPLLKSVVDKTESGIDVRFGWALESFEQSDTGVVSIIRNTRTGEEQSISSKYLVGTDGGNSLVRKGLGIRYEGIPHGMRLFMIHFLTDEYEKVMPFGDAWHVHLLKTNSVVISQDDQRSFTLHTALAPDVDASAIDPADWLAKHLGVEVDCEIKIAEEWNAHWLVARKYGEGRVWMAGDAVHQYLPTGGYGMNTGVLDAMDVSWKMTAMLEGWGGEYLLDTITAERRVAGLHSRRGSQAQAEERHTLLQQLNPAIAQAGQEGDRARGQAKAALDGMIADERGNLGVSLGYNYADSPIICFESAAPPGSSVWNYSPTTYVGYRAPHVFLEDGSAIYDHFGSGFTLINFADHDTSLFEQAAASCGMPLQVLELDEEHAHSIYKKDLLLIRPDQHVAWRGNASPPVPGEAERVINLVRGA
jgi:2-polyprenyl-6-methoxyphenol hydroxylase-like FAD-dependent oxidoreductase